MIPRDTRCLTAIVCMLVLSIAPAAAQDAPAGDAPPAASGDSIRARIDAIRDDLVGARFEKALAAVEGMLGEAGIPEAARAELLVLRSQTHVSFGDLDAAEEDFRQILRVRPEYVPDASLTSKKAMDRFHKVQADLVGKLRVLLDPADAHLVVGTRVTVLPADGMLILLAGEHRLRAEREGFDPVEQTVEIAAAAESTIEMRLVPNSRTVVLRTEPDGVEVFLDGVLAGVTRRPEGLYGSNPPPAELVIENVPLGDHDFELRKECFRDELLVDSLTVDLMQRTPKRYEPVALVAARSSLTLRGGPEGADVFLDGKPAGRLPHASFEVCPGTRQVELRFNDRVIWRSAAELRESVDLGLDVNPRPNAAVVGAEEWPAGFEAFSSRFNTLAFLPHSNSAQVASASGWKDVELPADTDIVLAIVPATRQGVRDKWYLYSPILRTVHELDVAPAAGERPAWYTSAWGLSTVDSRTGGAALAVEVFPTGPAAASGLNPGDRVVSVGGLAVAGAGELRNALGAASAARPLEIEWRTARGETKQGTLQGVTSPLLIDGHDSAEQAMVSAAWAVVDSACDPSGAASALANLALLFSEYGHHDLAVETWRRIRWGARPGIGEGTTQYYLGRELERLGQEQDAVRAYTSAATTTATAYDDFGPPVAPAAADRLADLGVTPPTP